MTWIPFQTCLSGTTVADTKCNYLLFSQKEGETIQNVFLLVIILNCIGSLIVEIYIAKLRLLLFLVLSL